MTAARPDLARRIDAAIGHVPDFPVAGFPFRDVTPLLEDDPRLFAEAIDALAEAFRTRPPAVVLCIESFGYVFGAPLGYLLGARIALARRAGKLPRKTHAHGYDMIYAAGKTLEVHQTAMRPGDDVLIVDDVLASGGSAIAALSLIDDAGADCLGLACVAEVAMLSDTPDRQALRGRSIRIVSLAKL